MEAAQEGGRKADTKKQEGDTKKQEEEGRARHEVWMETVRKEGDTKSLCAVSPVAVVPQKA
jgi:hypothetical protein